MCIRDRCIHLSIVAIFAQIYKSVDNHACQSNILNHTEEFVPNFDVIIASCGSVLDILKANAATALRRSSNSRRRLLIEQELDQGEECTADDEAGDGRTKAEGDRYPPTGESRRLCLTCKPIQQLELICKPIQQKAGAEQDIYGRR